MTYHGAERADAHVDELECGEEEPAAANSSKRKPGRRTPEKKEDEKSTRNRKGSEKDLIVHKP